jgi:processive 1,2-diacylglycerol beta-glucosyltransferase
MRICILYSPAGNGHRVASQAIAAALARSRDDVRVDVFDVLRFAPARFRYDLLWRAVQQHGTTTYDRFFAYADRPHRRWKAVRERLNLQLLAPLAEELVRLQPDHVVCTHYLPAITTAYLRRTGRLRSSMSTVITDYVAHEAWRNPGTDCYFAATPAIANALRARGIDRVELAGVPIAHTMDAAVTLPPMSGRVLVLTSGVPRACAITAVRALPVGLDVDIVTGGDDALRLELAALDRGRVHGFVPGLRAMIDAADVVVTKAGGLIVSECLARGRAMLLPWPAPGHEAGNRDHAIGVGAARACDPAHIAEALAKLPALAMGRAGAAAATRGAADRIAEVLLRAEHAAIREHRSVRA